MLKRLFLLVLLLGVAGAVVYIVRARRSAPEPLPARGSSVDEADAQAAEMHVREAGTAIA
jgi:hypothetical protein